MCSISSIHTESLHSSGNIHWSCFLMVWTGLSAVKTTSWPGLNFSVMAFVMFAAGSVTGSVISSRKRLLVLNNVSEVLEKYTEKLIWSFTSSGSFANFNSYSLVCADADPSRKNKSVSMSEETGVFGFPETVGWISVYNTESLPGFLYPELFTPTLIEGKLKL